MSTSKANNNVEMVDIDEELIEATLFRYTKGLPRRELDLMVKESAECETLLEKDIEILERALKDIEGGSSGKKVETTEEEATAAATSLSIIMESPLTPLDRFWTASALLGRLRSQAALPPISVWLNEKVYKTPKTYIDEDKAILELSLPNKGKSDESTNNMDLVTMYTKPMIPVQNLLTVWKKISTNRLALVFKKPVRDEEAPGYSDRIKFPMDLGLIRKRIVATEINSYASLHTAIGLISHNCVKYNGRESDYGRVAREFEAMADSFILQAVKQAVATAATVAIHQPAAAAVTAAPTTAQPLSKGEEPTKKVELTKVEGDAPASKNNNPATG